MIWVIATIEVAQGRRDEFLAEFRKIVPTVHQEAGCLEYGPTVDAATDIPAQSPTRPDVVTVVERWESIEALKDHLAAPHMTDFRERVKDIVRGISLQVLQPM